MPSSDQPVETNLSNLNEFKQLQQLQQPAMSNGGVMSNGNAVQFPPNGVLPNGAVGTSQESLWIITTRQTRLALNKSCSKLQSYIIISAIYSPGSN